MVDKKRNWKEVNVTTTGEVWDKSQPLEGRFLKAETGVGSNESNMYTIETDKGEIKVWGSTVLDDKLMGIPIGNYVKIEYEGKLKSKRGNEYHGYKVFLDEAAQPEPTDEADETIDLDKIFPEK